MRISLRRLPVAVLLLIVFASHLAAATKEYVAKAGARPQIDSITVANTWAAGDTATITIGNASIVVTCGSSTTTTAQVADVIKRAINATRIDENLVGDESRSAAGQQIGEFRDVEAVIDVTNTSRVLVRSVVAGVPFGTPGGNMTATEVTAGSGTVTRASVQTATGPWHWDATANWSTGSVPVNDDIVVFRGTANGPKYGLPAAIEVTVHTYMSFTGTIGLPQINTSNGVPYGEYRTRYLTLDEGGTGTAITHLIGMGAGAGSPNIFISHDSSITLVTSATIYNTGTSAIPGVKSVNLIIRNPVATNGVVTIINGSADLGTQNSLDPAWGTLNISGQNTDVLVVNQTPNDATINQSGGKLEWIETKATAGTRAFNIYGGECVCKDMQGAGNVTAKIYGGKMIWDATKTIATLIISSTGVFDLEKDGPGRGFTMTNCDLYKGASLLDGFARGTYTNGIDYNQCTDADCTVRLGQNKRRSISTVP